MAKNIMHSLAKANVASDKPDIGFKHLIVRVASKQISATSNTKDKMPKMIAIISRINAARRHAIWTLIRWYPRKIIINTYVTLRENQHTTFQIRTFSQKRHMHKSNKTMPN